MRPLTLFKILSLTAFIIAIYSFIKTGPGWGLFPLAFFTGIAILLLLADWFFRKQISSRKNLFITELILAILLISFLFYIDWKKSQRHQQPIELQVEPVTQPSN